jgi:hypothetical protein
MGRCSGVTSDGAGYFREASLGLRAWPVRFHT